MRVLFSEELIEELRKIQKKDKSLTKKINKQLNLFKNNPKHPSLRLHKLSGQIPNRWSISITMSIRMVYLLKESAIYFVAIGTHDEVYKK